MQFERVLKLKWKYCRPINLPFSLCMLICCSVWILEHSSVVKHWIPWLTIIKGNKGIKVCPCEEFLILHSIDNFFQSQILWKGIWKWSWSVRCFSFMNFNGKRTATSLIQKIITDLWRMSWGEPEESKTLEVPDLDCLMADFNWDHVPFHWCFTCTRVIPCCLQKSCLSLSRWTWLKRRSQKID